MVFPLMIAAMAAQLAGSAMQNREQEKNMKRMQEARERAFQQNVDQQRQFAAQAAAEAATNVQGQGREGFDEKMARAVDDRVEAFDASRINGPTNYRSESVPKNVALAAEQIFGESRGESKRDSDALAHMSAYGDATFGQGMDQNQFARAFGGIADTAGGQQRLLPLRMDSAERNAYKAPGFLGNFLKTAGQVGSMYAAAGAPGYADTATATPMGQAAAAPSQGFVGPMPNYTVSPGWGSQLDSYLGSSAFSMNPTQLKPYTPF